MKHFRPRGQQASRLLLQLIARRRVEGLPVSKVLEDFAKEADREIIQRMTPEELFKAPSPKDRLALAQMLKEGKPAKGK